VTAVPPVIGNRFNSPAALNPIHAPVGEKNGIEPPSEPASFVATLPSRSRANNAVEFPCWAAYTMRRPSREIAIPLRLSR